MYHSPAIRFLKALCLLAGAGLALAAHSQVLLDTTATLGKKPDAVVLPFSVAADGNYRLTVTDFGAPGGAPPPLARLDVGIARGSMLVTHLTGGGTADFAATAGDYRAIVIGQPTTTGLVGSAGVQVAPVAGGANVLDTVQAFSLPPPPAVSPAAFEVEVTVPGAGAYTLAITDFALPSALASLDTTVVRDGGTVGQLAGGGELAISAPSAGTYEVFVYAELASGVAHGLVGVNLRESASGAVVHGELHEIGDWPFKYSFDLPSAGALDGGVNDLGFPLPLASFGAVLAHDGRLAAASPGSGSLAVAAATAGTYTLYVDATAASGSAGSFGVQLSAGGMRVLETVQNVQPPGPATDAGTVDTAFDITTAGNYTLTLTDFGQSGFFDAFTSVALALTRDNQIVDTLDAPGNFVFAATPGHYSVAILGDPAGTNGAGLLGVSVRSAAGATVFEHTAAIGAAFISQQVDVSSPAGVSVTLSDLGFPAPFASLEIAVTRGSDRAGEIVGAGSFAFMATPGTYFVNMLATPDATLGYGTVGVNVQVTPPAPVVTLAASASNVEVGKNVTLTWSSTGATACTASGAWSGAQSLTGSTSVGPLNADSTFTLTCTGSGGSKAASVTVKVTPQKRSGGGAFDWLTLAGLLSLCAWRRRARRLEASQQG
jgi:hypothetical protein